MKKISDKVIGRLSLYRRILRETLILGTRKLFSYQLANSAGISAAQVRQDLMILGYMGSPTQGYDVHGLLECIEEFLDDPAGQSVALVGIGNLGRAILDYFSGRRPNLSIDAAFDINPEKTNGVIHSCRCYHLDQLLQVIEEKGILTAIITVPADQAQGVADRLVRAGIRGILNFAPVRVKVPPDVFVQDIDIAMVLEKVAYFSRPK